MSDRTAIAANVVNDAQETVAISDLIALFQSLKGARASLAGALALIDQGASGGPADLRAALMREEIAAMDERLSDVVGEIQRAGVRTRFDAIQKLRFRLTEFGDEPASAEIAINDYTQCRMLLPPTSDERLADRIETIERVLTLAAFAIGYRCETDGAHDNLHALVRYAIDELADIKDDVLTA